MNLRTFNHKDWVKIYDGQWSFLTSTHFIGQYRDEIRFGKHPFKSQSIIFISKNRSSGWMRQSDRDRLGAYLANQVTKNPKSVKTISSNLKKQARLFLQFIAKHENTVATEKLYAEFWRRVLAYYHPHINVKYVVDYLTAGQLEKYLPDLQAARLAAEPVLNRTEDFMIGIAKIIGKKNSYPYELVLCLTKEELSEYFAGKKLPKKSELQKRYRRSVLLGDRSTVTCYTGTSVGRIEKIVHQGEKSTVLKGSIAFTGKVTGVVRVVLDPHTANDFRVGDILVTGATRPEFLPIMHKAAAFVTDAGGILSHAAITAREMQKPCIIGTKIGTKVFKTGDRVEVDATKGVVRKIL